MNDYTERLAREDLSLMILKDGKTLFASCEGGMQPLLQVISAVGLSHLENSIVVDKVVGKAAALLISYFKAKETYCIIISERARQVLDTQKIKYYYERVIPEIKNKLGTNICPFEKLVLTIEDPKEGYERLSRK
ncbi:MAG: DUF1893 domain-containing protein [Candidatus Bathyarchaeota archaeon]